MNTGDTSDRKGLLNVGIGTVPRSVLKPIMLNGTEDR